LRGAIPFLVTPFDDAFDLDLPRLRRLVDRVADVGFGTIAVTGGVGELASLDAGERTRIWKAAVEAAEGRVAVLAGIGGAAEPYAPALRADARRAEDAGIDGLLLFPPGSAAIDGSALSALVSAVTSATALGVVLDHGAVPSSPDATRQAAGLPRLLGIKYSGTDAFEWEALRSSCDDLTNLVWLSGAGDCLAPQYIALGANAFTSSMANVAPRLVRRLSDCLSKGDTRGAHAAVQRMAPLAALRARRGGGHSLALLKAAMALQGSPVGAVRVPHDVVDQETAAELQRAVERLGED
jgi:dihydrodipicolinate synthase/N-acetylneuraminate lyase